MSGLFLLPCAVGEWPPPQNRRIRHKQPVLSDGSAGCLAETEAPIGPEALNPFRTYPTAPFKQLVFTAHMM